MSNSHATSRRGSKPNIIAFPDSAVVRRMTPPFYPPAPHGAAAVPLFVHGSIKAEQFSRALASAGLHIAFDRVTRCFVIRERQPMNSSTPIEGADHE
jgi:hypothetical protein